MAFETQSSNEIHQYLIEETIKLTSFNAYSFRNHEGVQAKLKYVGEKLNQIYSYVTTVDHHQGNGLTQTHLVAGDREVIDYRLNQYRKGNLVREKLTRPVVIMHVDTIGPLRKFYPESLISDDGQFLFGQGISDENANIAAMLYALQLLKNSGYPLPTIVVITDEEQNGSLGGLRLIENFTSNLLMIDTEPIAGSFGGFANRITARYTMSIMDFDDVLKTKPKALELIMYLQEQYPHLFKFDNSYGALNFSVLTPDYPDISDYILNIWKEVSQIEEILGIKGAKIHRPHQDSNLSSNVFDLLSLVTTNVVPEVQNFKLADTAITRSLVSSRTRAAQLLHNFDCMTAQLGKGIPWVVLGVSELGEGRHRPGEMVLAEQIPMLSSMYYQILIGLSQ